MKIGLAAVTYKENFGSALQTYATQYILEKLGHEVSIFEIKGVHSKIKTRKTLFYLRRMLDPVERRYIIDNAKSRFRKALNSPTDRYAANMSERHRMYEDFNRKWLKISDPVFKWEELTEMSRKKDAIIVGSDQLWRPSNIAGGFFTLEFVPETIKKISFATSFGVSELPSCLHNHAKKYLTRMDFISVRESSGQKIVRKEAEKEALVVCDPTMLLTAEEWLHIQDEKPFAEGDYILCYFMGDNPEHRSFATKLKESTGYRIIGLLHGATFIASDENFADEKPYNVGPADFINLIRYAQYVCTDSFHGTVFSILNKKKFFTFRRWSDNSQFSANDRLYTLLEYTCLMNRMLTGYEDIQDYLNDSIDYHYVMCRIAERREESIKFLINALES